MTVKYATLNISIAFARRFCSVLLHSNLLNAHPCLSPTAVRILETYLQSVHVNILDQRLWLLGY
jgi:hypothetical protein